MIRREIIRDGRILRRIDVPWFSEGMLEHRFLKHFMHAYQSFYICPFKAEVRGQGDEGVKKPDLAIISMTECKWWVVEVELSGHNLNHAMSQVMTFKNGYYSSRHSKYLTDKIKKQGYDLNEDKVAHIKKVVETETPSILVVLEKYDHKLSEALIKENIDMATFEIYKGIDGEELFRVKGKHPLILKDIGCQFTPFDEERALVSSDKSQILESLEKDISIHAIAGDIADFAVIKLDDGRVVFRPVEHFYIERNSVYALQKSTEGDYYLKKIN